MCGRFTLRSPASAIAEQFGLLEVPEFAARFNIAPTQPVLAVREQKKGDSPHLCVAPLGPFRRAPTEGWPGAVPFSSQRREPAWLRWGLVPSWAKDITAGNRLINARAETAAEKPAFRTALARRRCLIVADGFYEWRHSGRAKQPYFIRLRDDRPFAFAGLWDAWEGLDHGVLETCTLLTTDANELVRPIHDRMPVILPRDDYALWLDDTIDDPRQLTPLLRPYASEPMEAYAVDALVNSPANDAPQCVARKGGV